MKKIIAIALMIPLTGCLWFCRIPFEVKAEYAEDGTCTNSVWRSMITDCRMQGGTNNVLWCYYPTMRMRIEPWFDLYGKPIDPKLKGEDLNKARWMKRMGWLPLCIVWIGAPLDFVVDTIMIPWDYKAFKERSGK